MAQNKMKKVNIMGDVASYIVLVSFVVLGSPRVALQHPEFSSLRNTHLTFLNISLLAGVCIWYTPSYVYGKHKLSNFHTVQIPQRLTKKDTSLNPCGRTHFAKKFRNSQRLSILSVSKSSWSRENSSLRNSAYVDSAKEETPAQVEVKTCMWNWKGYSIRYQYAGSSGPALVLIHGFGANSDHWRKNIQVLAQSHRVFSIDLIGYGYSDKPNPRDFGTSSFYTFETWGTQLNDFCNDVVKDEAFFICNSIGGLVGLQAAVMEPRICKGILLLNISLRMLHIKKQPWFEDL